MNVVKSNRKNKRYAAIFSDGDVVHFGQANGNTYIDRRSKNERDNYINRHESNPREAKFLKNKDKYFKSPSVLSADILWGDSKDIKKNIKTYNKKYL